MKFDPLIKLFSFKRVSGQIAALILVSLVLIHALIAGYFILNQSPPQQMIDEPIHQFELLARVIDLSPKAERAAVIAGFNRAFSDLKLSIVPRGSSGLEYSNIGSIKLPSSMASRIVLLPKAPPDKNIARFELLDGDYVEARVEVPRLPAFLTALWTSTLLFFVASITLLALWAGRALTRPLSSFAKAAETFSISGASAALPEQGPEEIRSVAKALNLMRDRITVLVNDRTRLLAAISHDLRTPITRLRLRSEYIEDETHRLQILRDLDQMQSMLDSVIVLLRDGTGAAPRLVDVAAVISMACEEFEDCGCSVSYAGPDRLSLKVRPDEIKRAVSNLIDNAVRYGSRVDVELRVVDQFVHIIVSDDGPGIPLEKRRSMLEPFVRGDDARTMDQSSGFGLGLSIAQTIVKSHGGSLELGNSDSCGLRVTLVLPKKLSTAAS